MAIGNYFVASLVLALLTEQATSSYSNATLLSPGGSLSVVVYLPQGIKPGETPYYASTRFDHSSMIGSITRTTRDINGNEQMHVLYSAGRWRQPHNSYWTESGVGLAAEFGVGDDGAFCNYRCGWNEVNDVTNGVLGYREARNGESFLKIGVGELVKGTCITCDSTDDYKFNSPYQFAKLPSWSMQESESRDSVVLEHEAVLNENGYKLRKEITLIDDELLVKTTLTNIGRIPFATAWYSHHFFTCDNKPVGKGYAVDLNVTGNGGKYEEPGTWYWSTPLQDYAQVQSRPQAVSVEMERHVENGVRIKAEFVRDPTSNGGFTLRACGTSIEEKIPELEDPGGVSMYAFNLYIEDGTFSPEPQILMRLFPGEAASWTQQLVFRDDVRSSHGGGTSAYRLKTMTSTSSPILVKHPSVSFVVYSLVACAIIFLAKWTWRRKQLEYSLIPDVPA